MRELVYEELSDAIAELRRMFPEWRFGQLTSNLVALSGRLDVESIYNITDEELLVTAQRVINNNRWRLEGGTAPALSQEEAAASRG